jgi:hypothetical protein
MGVFVTCRTCNSKVYLQVTSRSNLSLSFNVRCPFCAAEHTFYQNEAVEEKWDFTCPVCSGRFFTRSPPPRRIRCPHCFSLVTVDESGGFTVHERGQAPVPPPGTRPAAGAFGGALLGGVLAGPIGALLGLIFGGALGASAEYLEAREE